MGTHSRQRPTRLPEKLIVIRETMGFSQGTIIPSLGLSRKITRERISAFERGDREPPYDILLGYGRLAGVFVDVLIDDELDLPETIPAFPKSAGVPSKPATRKPPTRKPATRRPATRKPASRTKKPESK